MHGVLLRIWHQKLNKRAALAPRDSEWGAEKGCISKWLQHTVGQHWLWCRPWREGTEEWTRMLRKVPQAQAAARTEGQTRHQQSKRIPGDSGDLLLVSLAQGRTDFIPGRAGEPAWCTPSVLQKPGQSCDPCLTCSLETSEHLHTWPEAARLSSPPHVWAANLDYKT